MTYPLVFLRFLRNARLMRMSTMAARSNVSVLDLDLDPPCAAEEAVEPCVSDLLPSEPTDPALEEPRLESLDAFESTALLDMVGSTMDGAEVAPMGTTPPMGPVVSGCPQFSQEAVETVLLGSRVGFMAWLGLAHTHTKFDASPRAKDPQRMMMMIS